MIHSVGFTALIDTNVMYPVVVRDILLRFAHYDLFTPKWSKAVFDEWIKVMQTKQVGTAEIEKRVNMVQRAFPDALVVGYEQLIPALILPDPNDRHILAAAILAKAEVIITKNLSDFPADYLADFQITAKSPDDFLTDIIDLNQDMALSAFLEMVKSKTRPPLTENEILNQLRNNDLAQTADYLQALI